MSIEGLPIVGQIVFDAVRMASIYVGGMLVIGAFHWWRQSMPNAIHQIRIGELHVWAMMSGLSGILAFAPGLLADFNLFKETFRSPWIAIVAAHLLFATQAGFAVQIAMNRKLIRRVIFGFYLVSLVIGTLHHAMKL